MNHSMNVLHLTANMRSQGTFPRSLAMHSCNYFMYVKIILQRTNLIPRSFPDPSLDCLQYAKTTEVIKAWMVV